jgi:hypothetical protein
MKILLKISVLMFVMPLHPASLGKAGVTPTRFLELLEQVGKQNHLDGLGGVDKSRHGGGSRGS